jgi:hypothetical protein
MKFVLVLDDIAPKDEEMRLVCLLINNVTLSLGVHLAWLLA